MNQLLELIESAISRLHIDPVASRGQTPYTWLLIKGDAKVYVEVIFDHPINRPLFQVRAPMLDWPNHSSTELLGKTLLACNSELVLAAFCLDNGKVSLKETRELPGLDESEVLDAITKVGEYADTLDEWLADVIPQRTPIGFRSFSVGNS